MSESMNNESMSEQEQSNMQGISEQIRQGINEQMNRFWVMDSWGNNRSMQRDSRTDFDSTPVR